MRHEECSGPAPWYPCGKRQTRPLCRIHLASIEPRRALRAAECVLRGADGADNLGALLLALRPELLLRVRRFAAPHRAYLAQGGPHAPQHDSEQLKPGCRGRAPNG